VQGSTISCTIQTLAVNQTASVEVDMTPASPVTDQQILISGNASWNGTQVGGSVPQPVANVVDFTTSASVSNPSINAGQSDTITVAFCPTPESIQYGGYSGTISPSQTISPSMVTATTPTFTPTPVALGGSACGTTTLTIATVARPVTSGSLLRRGSFYATWLPIGGLSLVGLGIGVGRKRRRWLAGAVLGLIAGIILLQPGCGSSSSSTQTSGGTAAGKYTIMITGAAGTGASHQQGVQIVVN
jgi:hypothetical protein